jgi:putative Mn2+ efflux pump MntP
MVDVRLLPLVLSLGADTFAVSVALGVAPLPLRTRLRLALVFAAADGLMPAVGLLLGRPLGTATGRWAVYVAAALLVATGVWMMREGLERDDDDGPGERDEEAMVLRASAGGLPLLAAALSVSLDELAVGFSFGVLRLPVGPALVVIALQALCVSLFGLWLGRRVGVAVGERAELLAGLVLCLLGVALAVARLSGLADL